MNSIKKIFFCVVSLYCINVYGALHLVTNTNDSGLGSLRQAILDANLDGTTPRAIHFSIGSGVQIIQPVTALPALAVSQIIIDGSTQPGWSAGNPVIIIDGANAGFSFDGLTIQATDSCIIQDMVINNGFNSGITIVGNTNNNAIYGCFIGVDQSGSIASPNSLAITLSAMGADQNNNTIIGAANRGNVLSGNAGFFGVGMFLSGNLQNMRIRGNFIGTDKTGTFSIPNAVAGFAIISQPSSALVLCNGAIIGGPGVGEGNVISGNSTGPGFFMGFQNVNNTTIQGNKVGVDITGTLALPNGIGITTFTDIATTINGTIIGGAALGEGNVISANPGGGVGLQINCNNSVIKGNFIGTDITGTIALGNGGGIGIQGNNNSIGGSSAVERNIISNNGGSGIYLGPNSSNNSIQGNYIGVDITGTTAMGNANNGIEINGYDFGTQTPLPSNNNVIGGAIVGERNIISNSGSSSILLNLGVNDTIIKNNYIGTDVTGSANFGNSNSGIQIQGYDFTNKIIVPSDRTIIGGINAGNIISGSGNQGIQLNLGCNDTIIRGNHIGVDVSGLVGIPNGQQGVQAAGFDFNPPGTLAPCNNTTIGGAASGERNIISANFNEGIQLNTGVNNTVIKGNYIGVGADGVTALGNINQGINIFGNDQASSDGTIVGGSAIGEYNIISANGNDGIFLQNNVNDSIIQGNYIGTDQTATVNLGNGIDGIQIAGSNGSPCINNLIGGINTAEKNTIQYNNFFGIDIGGDVTTPDILNPVLGNSIFLNGNNGIILHDNGNNLQQSPTIISANYSATDNVLIVSASAPANPAASFFRLEFFVNSVDRTPITEGERFAGAISSVPTSSTITQSFTVPGISVGQWISATATNLNNTGNTPGDTSEFTANVQIQAAIPPSVTLAAFPLSIPAGNPVTLTATIAGTGPYSLVWSDGFVQSGVTSPAIRIVNPLLTTTYSVTAFDVYGVSSLSNDVTIIVHSLPFITLTANPVSTVPGGSVVLTATPSGEGPFTLTWSDGLIQTNVTGPVIRTVIITAPTEYSVTVIDSNGGVFGPVSVQILIGRISPIVQAIIDKYCITI